MNKISKIKFPPIKYKPLNKTSEELVYKTGLKLCDLPSEIFIMLRFKKPDERCYMAAFPTKIERDEKKNVPSLYISKILSTPMRSGLGSKMLDFAKYYSQKNGCNGYFHLDANSGYLPNSVPHIFYRKQGMNTKFSYLNKRLDKYIKKGKNATYRDIENITMYYPPIEKPKNRLQVLFEKLFT